MPDVLLRAENLTKHFPVKEGRFGKQRSRVHALDGIELSVYRNEILGIVGESGCGKSTLARVLLNLIEPTAGTVSFDGVNLQGLTRRQMREQRREMQLVFQDPFSSLDPRKTVRSLIAEPLDIHRVGTPQERTKRASELMETVGLSRSYLNRYPHEFSGGQRQRIGIARALALRPKLIVCDEPVSALDVSVQAQIINLLQDLQQQFGLTYLFIAHGLDVVRHISDRIAVMYLGKLVEIGPADTIFTASRHPYTCALISAMPKFELNPSSNPLPLKGEIPSPIHPPAGCRFHTRCPFAQERCRREEPALTPQDEHHSFACHFPLPAEAETGVRPAVHA
ncbi:ABC transporter ATP-binding protein [Paenibacillus sp. J31TS4]|uniref:ABC transporter ATP-binding protein n=1 Tax=Paenibacillus sp. J31TS4 TaxID=2807195 RepID=UPI001B28E71C|nr:dipeptide ABC transporter ATP-binding protein [Paenibacillus sp. J31TS4]GIP41218.1 ABC transporter ATP-binding protein [Paenibacillus sp. J31TS4]